MKKYGYLYMAAALMLPQVLPTYTYAEEVAPTVQLSFDERMEETMKALAPMFGIQSLQYAVLDDGELIASGDTANTTDTLYGIGSVSKVYTTMAVMQLVEQGKIDLDTPVITYIPEFEMADERYKDITPRMLLNHSSGLMGSTFKNMILLEDNDTYSTSHLLEALKTQWLKADPGAFSVYCNDGFTLAEILVERVSGMSFTDYIHTYITEPLKLEHTVTPQDDWDGVKVAPFYNTQQQTQPLEVSNNIGTGGIYATAEDLARLGEVYLGKYKQVLSQEMVDLTRVPEYQKGMWLEEDCDSAIAYGLGWDHVSAYPFSEYEIPALVKGGDIKTYHASLIVLPEEEMVAAVVATGGMSTYNHLLGTHLLMARLQEEGKITEVIPTKAFAVPETPVAVPEKELEKAGKYGSMGLVLDVAILPEGQVNLSFVGVPEAGVQNFIHTGDGKYVSADGTSQISFVVESNGETYMKVDSYADIPGVGGVAASDYQAQKLKENPLSPEVQQAWEKREGKVYYILDEKYSSIGHVMEQGALIGLEETLPGYIGEMMITSENEAKSCLQIPGNYGRDVADIAFYVQDGIEYMKYRGYTAISEDGVQAFDFGTTKEVTIEANGYAKWYTIAPEAVGKLLQVKMPENASFAVYDAAGTAVNFSRMTDVNEVVLPEGSSIVFMGDAGVAFEIIEGIQ